jgi:hypothetical protein
MFNTKFPLRLELVAGKRGESSYGNGIKKRATIKKKTAFFEVGLSLPLYRTIRDF